MPFTLSHPLAALLLNRTGRPLAALPLAAMVAGTMAPDLPMFLPAVGGYSFTHSLLGIVTADLVISVAVVVLWLGLIRDAMVDTAPAFVRERLSTSGSYSRGQWTLVVPAAIIGSMTHVGWDAFTHEGRWGVKHIAWLQGTHLNWSGYHWAQAASSVIGLAGTFAWAGSEILRRPRHSRPPRVPGMAEWVPVVALTLGGAVGGVAILWQFSRGLHAAAIAGAELGVSVLAAAVICGSVTWRLVAS